MNDMNIYLFLILLPLFFFFIWIPYLTRKTESFGVSIPEEIYGTAKLRSMRKKYAFATSILSITVSLIWLFLFRGSHLTEHQIALYFSVIIIGYILLSFIIYLYFHSQMKQLKEQENWHQKKNQQIIVDTTFRDQKLTHSNAWFIPAFLITLATILLTIVYYDRIPNQIPINYDFSGQVTNWTEKTTRSILFMPAIQVCMTLLFIFINAMIARAKQQVSAADPKKSMLQGMLFRRRWSAFMIISGTLMVLLFAFAQLSFIFTIPAAVLMAVTFGSTAIILFGAIVLSFTTGQGGSRIKVNGEANDGIDRDDDRYWKLGQFYVNKNDPSIFLEKRFGIGWTVNFGNPISWLILIGIIAIPILLSILLT
ncbi:DUF1648 domain-containing protein [Ornithinibacillus gellani]|uniref:DUF1648 domain-containing protein n=1 Tax=Ornithinibacillus gellani TaxID=2293253 RepID=UPI000F48FBA3|nr:DUF5808 domain-containing protein [Ornithinibacillus gellani]TQS70633.1 DUF1648 domain-containing protein [Ornithinibacillus gellani]